VQLLLAARQCSQVLLLLLLLQLQCCPKAQGQVFLQA
jgi:hypothetical protein